MNGYIINFAIYSFAMVGFFLTVLFIYKKSITPMGKTNQHEFLKVENTLKLSPVKTIYVIKAGSEKFLIAGDTANTTMLAKLECQGQFHDKQNLSVTSLKNEETAQGYNIRLKQDENLLTEATTLNQKKNFDFSLLKVLTKIGRG